MAIEAPISRFKKNNLKIYIVVCILIGLWLGYDGYFNEKFREKHTDAAGKADSTLVFNRRSPPFFIGAAVVLGAYLFVIRNKKLIADENELVISPEARIAYDSIERIDKTHFDSKGFFIIAYRDKEGKEVHRRLTDKTYDNLAALLEHLVAKIS